MPVLPLLGICIPAFFLAERFHRAADTNQTVGNIAGRLDFDIAIPWIFTLQIVRSDGAAVIDVVINTTGARIPTIARGVVFKGAVLRTPPHQIRTVFFGVFRLMDARVGKADDFGAFQPALIGRATESALVTVFQVARLNPFVT